MPCHDVDGVALLSVEGHAPGICPFHKWVEVLLELFLVLEAVDAPVEEGIVHKQPDLRLGIQLSGYVIYKHNK